MKMYKSMNQQIGISHTSISGARADMLKTLIGCGLNEYESKVYIALTFLGPSKAGDVSRESCVPQSRIYNTLNQLIDKQLVEVFDGRPKEFKAVEPEVALKAILEDRMKEIKVLKERVKAICNCLKPTVNEKLSGIWMVKDKKWAEFFNKTAEMLRRSKSYVYSVTKSYSRSAKFAEAVRACVRRGVRVRVMGMSLNESNHYKAKWYHEQGIFLRTFKARVHPHITLVDGREVLLRLDNSNGNRFRFNSLWSEDASFVKVIDGYMKNLWKSSQPVKFRKHLR